MGARSSKRVLEVDVPNVGSSLSSFHRPTTSSQSLFRNARNIEVKDSQINAIANANVTINNGATNNDSVITILWPHVAAGAIFDSAARYAAGKCHPGTRKKIIDRIIHWIKDPDRAKHILWIYGSAGAGKSALGHTMCELLKESHPDEYGASFFFADGSPDRGNALKLFTTLAYQLAIQFPSIRAELNDVLSRDPSLPTKSMEIQLHSLIVEPLLRCQAGLLHSPVLIIDGLDECANDKGTTQGNIVALISKCVVEYRISLRFVILSRPEYWIRDAFDTPPLPDITLLLSLRDDIAADEDIKKYLTNELDRIRVENKRFMRSVDPPWPPTKIVDRLVEEASGQYIYAATILKFVGNFSKFSDPQKQLNIIISPGPHRALAFSELDRLYATILSAYPRWETMKRVLAALLLEANSTIITVVLGMDPNEVSLVLDALSSLIDVKKPKPLSEDQMFLESIFDSLEAPDKISFSHRSFREFLQDKARSGPFYIDLNSDSVPSEIVNGYFDMVHRNLDQNYNIEPHVFLNIDRATYTNTIVLVTVRSTLHCTISMLFPLITHMNAKLRLFDLGRLTHMHCVFYFIRALEFSHHALWHLFLDNLLDQRRDREKPEILEEFQTACQNLKQAISLAWNGALSGLVACTDFKATPLLVYMTEYGWVSFSPLPLDGIRTIAGIGDVISVLRQHRYILRMGYDTDNETWSLMGVSFFRDDVGPDWRTQGTWRDLRISFAHKAVKSLVAGHHKDSHEIVPRRMALASFFNLRSISDIGDKEYFQTKYNIAILTVMTDLETWIDILDNDLPESFFLVSILCWINRQLTNQQTVSLLQGYDDTLQERMATVMKHIFKHGFLQRFTEIPQKGLCAFASGDGGKKHARSTAIKVWPLPNGFYEEEVHCYSAEQSWYPDYWQTFHDELFGKTVGNINSSINPIIHPSQWHPHLVTPLLKVLVRFLYSQIHADFSEKHNKYEESFPYITQCLPYALPTTENLDALRAIVYLYPQVTPTWTPPAGLWPLIVEFLHKFDRSLLSSEELRLFVLWLNDTDHADIKTYVGQ